MMLRMTRGERRVHTCIGSVQTDAQSQRQDDRRAQVRRIQEFVEYGMVFCAEMYEGRGARRPLKRTQSHLAAVGEMSVWHVVWQHANEFYMQSSSRE
jgi:hypothetical protein